jgi:hypothetical protein
VNNRTGNRSFSIPADNPFVGLPGALTSIYAYGFRNPISLAFDNETLFVSDAGQACWEEVDIVVRGGNYGWNLREGAHCFDLGDVSNCKALCRRSTGYYGEALIDPIIEVKNPGTNFVISGGAVYQGSAPSLNGTYIFATWGQGGALYSSCTNSSGIWSYKLVNVTSNDSQSLVKDGSIDAYILGLGQGSGNATYLLTATAAGPNGNTGSVWKIS